MKIKLDQPDTTETTRSARDIVTRDLVMFEAFLAPVISPASVSIDDLEPIKTDNYGNTLIHVYAMIGGGASAVVSNDSADFDQVSIVVARITPQLLEAKDCRIALHYYAAEKKETDPLYKFLNLITSAEAMVSESDGTTQKVSRRMAVLKSPMDPQPNLLVAFDQFKDWYDTRSAILHGREMSDITQADVSTLEGFVRIALRNYLLIRTGLSRTLTKQKLDQCFEQNKLDEIRLLVT